MPLPLHHAYSLTVGLTTGMGSGVGLILPAGVSGPELVAALVRGEATVLLGVPRLYSALVAGIRTQVAARGGLVARLFPRLLGLARALRPLARHGRGSGDLRQASRRLRAQACGCSSRAGPRSTARSRTR